MMKQAKDIDAYIDDYPKPMKGLFKKIRQVVQVAAPKAEETIKYGIPTFVLDGKNLVHFGGFKNHVGFYPTPSAMAEYKKDLSKYESGKGSVQFPLSRPLPLNLIKKIVKYRIQEVSARSKKA